MRRWLWPYAILATLLSFLGNGALLFLVFGSGADRAGAQLSVANAVAIEPMSPVLISLLDMVAPFELSAWFKEVYAILALVALGGLALYRGERRYAGD